MNRIRLKMEIATAGQLMEIRARASIAHVLMLRQVEPNQREQYLLSGKQDITLRDLGEIYGDLGFQMDLMATDLTPNPPTIEDTN